MYDIGIIGGGTAGLTAAIYGQRAGKQTIVLEGKIYGGQIASSPRVENYPGVASISGSDFSTNLLQQAQALGAETRQDRVTEVSGEEGAWVIHTGSGEIVCKSVIIATGVVPRKLGLEGESRLEGMGVSYCATCDGAFFRNMPVAVIGGGNTALEDAEFLSNTSSQVYLIHRRDEFRGEEALVNVLRNKENVEFVLSATPKAINGMEYVEELVVNELKTGGERSLEVAAVFIAVGHIPMNQTYASLVELDEYGFINANETCHTSQAGIFTAGDCRTKEVRQLTTAAADGAVAALAAIKYLALL